MKLYKSAKEPEIYHYFNSKQEKLWMFRHKYYDASGKRKEKKKSGFKTEKAALKALLEVKAQTLRGDTKHIEYDNLTIAQWLDIWYETNKQRWKPATVEQREIFIRLHLKPLLGHYKLSKLDRITYQRNFLNVLQDKCTYNTLRSIHAILRIALNAALQDGYILRNNIVGVKLPSERKNKEAAEKNYLTPSELNKLLNVMKENEDIAYYTLFLTIAYTGMRKGEALGLQWRNIDFINKTITVERNRGTNGIGSTKTQNSERTIKVDNVVIIQLKSYLKAVKKLLLKYGKRLKDNLTEEQSLIFISPHTGEPLPPTGINHLFNRNVEKAKLPSTTIHGLRHTHATILMNNGIPVKAIAERLGNTPEMVHTVYGHVLKELEDKTVSVFSETLKISGAKSGANS